MADIHIRLSSERHAEYREVFERLYTVLQEDTEKAITVICGDILHSKTELSPECVDLTIELIKNLSGIMDVIIIMGNHDGNLSNKTKLDSLSPLVREIKGKHNIHYLLNSGIYRYNNINFGVSSIFDDQFIKSEDILDTDNLKIGLYHGCLNSCETDVGVRLNSELSIEAFDGYDYVLLGDIHRFQYMDKNERICYPSSLIQQNYGESLNNHGIVIWDLENETSTFRELQNDYGYCCITVRNGKMLLNNVKVPKNPRIKLIVDNTDGVTVKELSQRLRKKYNIQELTYSFVGNNKIIKKKNDDKTNTEIYQNLQDINYQNTLIKDYIIKNMTLSKEEIDEIVEINNRMNKEIVNSVTRTNKWKLLNMDFSNMFCYGQKNEIDFGKLDGIVGLFAPNYSGKSSIVDIILFTLFDRCSRGLRTDILNQKKTQFHCRINLEIEGCEYVIMRIGKFPKKNAKMIKIDVHFWKKNPSPTNDDDEYLLLNGIDRNETNKIISTYIGTYDDYVMTSFCLQKEISFLDYPQSKKKEFLMKMLKLNIYEQLLENAKSENKLKVLQLKDLSIKTKNVDIYELRNKLNDLQKTRDQIDGTLEKLNILIEKYHSRNETYHKKLIKVNKPSTNKTISQLQEEMNANTKKINNYNTKIKSLNTTIEKDINELAEYKGKYNDLDPDNILSNFNSFNNEKTQKINKLNIEIKKLYGMRKSIKNYSKTLEEYQLEKETLDTKIKELDGMIKLCEFKINNEQKGMVDESSINSIKELHNEYSKINNEINENTLEMNMIDKEIKQMQIKLDKLSQHKYNPDCEFCMNNIFVKDALQTKSQLEEKKQAKEEINKTIIQLSKKLKLKKYNDIEEKYDNIETIKHTNQTINNKIKDLTHKKALLSKDINMIMNEIETINKTLVEYNNEIENIKFNEDLDVKIQSKEDEIKVIQDSKYEVYDIYIQLKDTISTLETSISNNKLEITKYNKFITDIENGNQILNNYIKEVELYNKNLEENETINTELNKIKDGLNKSNNEIKRLLKEKDSSIEEICYIKKEIELYENYTTEIKKLESETKAYNNYIKIINKDGLPYMLLNNVIPLLQEGANNLLLPLTNFSISIEQDDDNSITVYKINNNNKLNVELCSGFEKFIIGLSIRISLINLSKLSACNFMLIDEGFSCMDNNNINNLTSLFNTLKDMFDFVIIISHLDSVKSQCDNYMTININSGFSNITYT